MGDTLAQVNEYLDLLFTYGAFWVYLVLFLACFIENIFPPFPGDTFILAAAVLAALGRLELPIAFALVNIGGLSSVMLLYLVGRRYGRGFFREKNYRYFSTADIDAIDVKFERWGGLILLLSRFVVGFRSALALVAGIGRYPAGRMIVYSAISYVVFTGVLTYIAVKLVDNLDRIEHLFDRYNQIVWPVLVVACLLYVYSRYRKLRKGKTR